MKPTLAQRLEAWGNEQGWEDFCLVPDGFGWSARFGPCYAHGLTTNEAFNGLADAMALRGWPDDRGPRSAKAG